MSSARKKDVVAAVANDAFARPSADGRPVDASVLEANRSAALRFVERVLGQGDMATFDEIVAEDVWVSTGLEPSARITSKAEYRQVLGDTLGHALSNGHMAIHEALVTTDGAVVIRFTATADHIGTIDGIAPTNRRLVLSESHLMRFREGRLVENDVGALNPLQWEMIYAPVIALQVLR